ncbi:hypothetical protein B0H16DRAFT_1558515 [Mycena metata]|uniref:Uncharacterized protein n=1 Tax=Mycena metata TaxID=1033252 RepID=A0AAD7IKT0_9AGAR|nr:hypothetical protein B0H16DRAFT_1558515 [Mycena metata]
MLFSLPSRARLKHLPKGGRLKLPSSPKTKLLSDVLWTSMVALKESADAFPPLKSAVCGTMALWDIAKRAKHSKADACAIALRAQEILHLIADAVPDASAIPEPMLRSITRFTVYDILPLNKSPRLTFLRSLLDDIGCSMQLISDTPTVTRLMHLNRNEQMLQRIRTQLDEAQRDFDTASNLRIEVQQAQLALKHSETDLEIKGLFQTANTVLRHTRFIVFLAVP